LVVVVRQETGAIEGGDASLFMCPVIDRDRGAADFQNGPASCRRPENRLQLPRVVVGAKKRLRIAAGAWGEMDEG
jgi:hypothetical protein